MAKTRLEYDILDCPADEPIVFAGPPGRLTGRLVVRNGGDDRAVLRHATVRGGALAAETVAPVRTTVLRPASTASLLARVAISPSTPPGDYHCEVEIGGSVRPAVLRVAEVVDVVVEPATLYVENAPGTRITKRVLVTNRGNVPITVGHPGGIALDDERAECRVTRATYDALGRALEAQPPGDQSAPRSAGDRPAVPPGPTLSLERALGEWVAQGRKHLASVGVLGVRNAQGSTAVAGGEQAAVELTFRVPRGLDQHTRYVGSFPLYNADLTFVIVPRGDTGAPSEEDIDENA